MFPFVTFPLVRSKQLEWSLHWIVLPVRDHAWFVSPPVHVQICIFVPSAAEPPVTSRHLLSKICSAAPATVQLCPVEPPATQSAISTAAPSALEAAVRHFSALRLGWMYWFGVGVGVGPEDAVVVVEVKTGVPVSHGMEPPQAAPGIGVPSQVQEAYARQSGKDSGWV